MGRTIPSYRMALEAEISEWNRFVQFLRADERKIFAELMNTCRIYASNSGAACRPIVSEAMFMSILLSHQKIIKELKSQLDELRKTTPARSNKSQINDRSDAA